MSQKNPHTISWFEVPVNDIERARKFYEAVLDLKLDVSKFEGFKMAVFPGRGETEGALVHGALIEGETYEPCVKGSLIYFNGGDDLAVHLSKVKEAGGEVIREKFAIGEHGHIAIFKDTEGNRVALHSMN